MLSELIDLLANGALEPQEIQEIVKQIEDAPNDPEYDPAVFLGDDLMAMLSEMQELLYEEGIAAYSDKIDELHEQIQEQFDWEFPDFPHELFENEHGAIAYFDWLDAELAQRAVDEGGYSAILMESGPDDRMCLFMPYTRDKERVIELGNQLGMRFEVPLAAYR